MSAYLCNPTHIGILAQQLANRTKHYGNAVIVADAIATENLNSVNHRYSQAGPSAELEANDYRDRCRKAAIKADEECTFVPPLRLIGMAQCTEYQCCEHPGWRDSKAFDMVDSLYKRAVAEYLDEIKVKAGWEWQETASVYA